MDRFWLYFFTFLIVLVVLLGIFRPDQLDNALAMLGLFLTILLWTVAGLAVLALGINHSVIVVAALVFLPQITLTAAPVIFALHDIE